MSEIDDLLPRFEKASDLASLAGVPVLVSSCDAFTLVEYVKSLRAERNVLRGALEALANQQRVNLEDGTLYQNSEGAQRYAQAALDKLYARPVTVAYPTRQE